MDTGGARLDERPVDPAWSAPATDGSTLPTATPETVPPGTSWRSMLVVVIGVVVLALVGAGLWLGGAFAKRTDYGWNTAPGTVITAGPFEMSFTKVTVQKTTDYDKKVVWQALVVGSGRSTADKTLLPNTFGDSGMFILGVPGGASYPVDIIRWGSDNRIGDGSGFTPGLPPIPFKVQFELPDSYVPGPVLTFGAFDQELRDNSLLQDQEPSWLNADHYYRFTLPVERLPDQDSS